MITVLCIPPRLNVGVPLVPKKIDAVIHSIKWKMKMQFQYSQDGTKMRVGDRVRMKRWLRRNFEGVIVHVYDPDRPSPPNGDNEFGFTLQVDDCYYWIGGPPNHTFELVEGASD